MEKNTQQRQSFTLALAVLAAGLAAAGATWFAVAGTASAPEPARQVQNLVGGTGATGAAVYDKTDPYDGYLYYSSTWRQDNNGPAAGTPCVVAQLLFGAEPNRRIRIKTLGKTVLRACMP
jgi:hypothetical protein